MKSFIRRLFARPTATIRTRAARLGLEALDRRDVPAGGFTDESVGFNLGEDLGQVRTLTILGTGNPDRLTVSLVQPRTGPARTWW